MRAITVQQPWASAIATGAKTVENRSWWTSYRGPLAIHAGTRWSDRGGESPLIADWWGEQQWPGADQACHPLPHRELFPTGAIIAVAELVDVHPDAGCCPPWGEATYLPHGKKRDVRVHHWVLEDIHQLAVPVDSIGRLGLWPVADDVVRELAEAVAHA